MPRHQAVIFDCDGTLADTMPIHYLAWRETMSIYGIEFTEDRFYSLGGCPPAKIIRMLADEQGVTVEAEAVAEEKENRFLESISKIEPIQPVVDIVREHEGEAPIGVGTGSGREVVQLILKQIGLHQTFDCVVASEDTERHKPEPDVFLLAAKRLNVTPEECTVYEDSDLGIEAAKRAGMNWVDVRDFHTPRRWT